MTQFAGFLPVKPLYTQAGTATRNLDLIAEDQTQLRAGAVTKTRAGGYVTHQPLDTAHSTRSGMELAHLGWFFYNRIQVIPRLLALGNVIGVQKRDVTVWNAYFSPRTLEALIKINAEGIDVTNQTNPPLVFQALEEKIWNVQVTSDGPPSIDATLSWVFTGEDSVPVQVTGSRLVIWSFYPTWEGGITETLEWKTDVITGPLGDEQRRALRISPRRGFKLQLIATDAERRYMELLVFTWGARNWAIPIWNDVQELLISLAVGDQTIACQTAGRDFSVGGLVMLRGEDAYTFEAVEVASISPTGLTLARPLQSNWPRYTKIYPVRTARFAEQPEMTKLTDRAVTMSASFLLMETSDWVPSGGAETHRGAPVYRVPPEETESLTSSYVRLLQAVDNGMSLPRYYDRANLGFTVAAYRWLLHGRPQQSAMRSLLYYLQGQWKSVYVPTHYDDMRLVDVVAPTSSVIDIEWTGYTQYGAQQPGRRDLMFTLTDGRVFFKRITGSAEVDQGTERLSLDSPFGIELRPAMIQRISYMALCRLESDSVDIEHQTDSDGVANSRVVFRSLREDSI